MIRWMQVIIRVALAGLFIYAGMKKLIEPNVFLSDIESYRMMPYSLAWLVALYLPALEILCGLGLLWSGMRIPSAMILIALMLAFIVAISVAWLRGLDISCGCFGTSEGETNYLRLIIRDLLIIIALIFCGFKSFNRNE